MSTQLPPPSSMNKQAASSAPAFVAASPTAMNMAQNTSHNMSQFINNSFQQQSGYSPPKAPFSQAYQHIPGIQSLPASAQQPVQPSVVPPVQPPTEEKPQSNGTTGNEVKDNHVASLQKNNAEKSDKEKVDKHVPEPAEVPQVSAASGIPSCANTTMLSTPATSATSPTVKAKDESEPKTPVKEVTQPIEKVEKSPEKHSPVKTEAKPKPVETCNVDTTSSTFSESSKSVEKVKHEGKVEKVNKPEEKYDVDSAKVSVPSDNKEKKEECLKLEAQSTTADGPATPPTLQKLREQSTPVKSPIKVATTPRTPQRKSRTPKTEESPRTQKPSTILEPKPSTSKSPGGSKTKRSRLRTQHYQSPLPEDTILSKISQTTTTTPKSNENKLIVFYKNEFLAVRNSEGGFFICQAVQNVYKSSSRIKIRWLSQEKNDKSGEIYTPDFYDFIDFECILTNLELSKVVKGKFRLPAKEHDRTDNILKKAIAVEKGEDISLDDSMTEDNPDGLDVSLYTEEDQLMKKGTKRKLSKGRPAGARSSHSPKRAAKESSEPPEKTPKRAGRKAAEIPASEPKRVGTAGGRAERAKRRSATEEKTSPVIDNKKAKMLAKVVKRTVASVPTVLKPVLKTPKAKETKPSKQAIVVASTSKAKVLKTTPPQPQATRKTPKRGRK